MAAGIMSEPGSQRGPCVDCVHIDCAEIRADAQRICPACGAPIGYGRRFYVTGREGAAYPTLVHADCVE